MKNIAIIGSGIVGTTLAYHLVRSGHRVHLFENGPDIPYPHIPQFENEVLYTNRFSTPPRTIPSPLPKGIRGLTQSGDYPSILDDERSMCVGGQATRWWGMSPRLLPESFQPKTLHGYGDDWPITYNELEPYYCKAEQYLGISGSAEDNPFAPPRSQPYPLPAFEFSYKDLELSAKLNKHGLVMHTTPQARARHAHEGRPACQNFGKCNTCPIGARYSPNYHLNLALKTGLVTLHTCALVRRIVMEGNRARALVYHPNHGSIAKEHPADVIIVAAGAIESARLLLLSRGAGMHRNGLGNSSGLVGRNLGFHHIWRGHMHFNEKMMAGKIGPPTMLSHQFIEPPGTRGYGGVSVELFDYLSNVHHDSVTRQNWQSGTDIVAALQPALYCRALTFNAEAKPSPKKYVAFSEQKDRFGDPFMHVHYELDEFDYETYGVAQMLSQRFAKALEAESVEVDPVTQYWSAHHHLGTCRMGTSMRDSVVDSYGAIHETQGIYVCGGSTFVTATALQPTLTMVALAIRSAEHIGKLLI